MKTKLSNYYVLSKATAFKSKLVFGLIFLLTNFLIISKSLAQNCSSEELSACDVPTNCEPENSPLICVRVLFHFLNNTDNPDASPSDQFCFELLQRTNRELKIGNVRITFDYNCVHREKLTEDFRDLLVYNTDISKYISVIPTPDVTQEIIEQMEYDPNSINVYILQRGLTGAYFGSQTGKHTVTIVADFPTFIHELGHCLGLAHTFSLVPPGQEIAIKTNCCKDLTLENVNHVLHCLNVQDNICDTETDPYSFDLDGIGGKDEDIWVDYRTCTQKPSLLNSYEDGCGNSTLPWKIPIANYMSYYQQCRTEFTPCQYGRMHESLTTCVPEVILEDPESDPYKPCEEDDIEINSIVPWENVHMEFCPGQKIIITSNGFLEITKSTLTTSNIVGPNSMCPDLAKSMWEGIVLLGRGSTVLHNGKYITLGGISITDESSISYAKIGIRGLKGYGTVEIDESSFFENGAILDLKNSWPYSYDSEEIEPSVSGYTGGSSLCGFSIFNPYPSAKITNSSFIVKNRLVDDIPTTQFKIDGGSLYFIRSQIENPNDANPQNLLTAIKSGRGLLLISNGSSISNFDVGVFKAGDIYNNCSPRGLIFSRSSIIHCDTSIHNTSQFASVKDSYISGDVEIDSYCFSNWQCNAFMQGWDLSNLGMIHLDSPEKSCVFMNNLAHKSGFSITGLNDETKLSCVTWQGLNTDAAMFANFGATLPLSLGGGIDKLSSGNKHLDGSHLPLMFSETASTTNYFQDVQGEHFSYNGIEGEATTNLVTCNDNCWPTEPPPFTSPNDEESFNYSQENTKWLYLDSLKTKRTSELSTFPEEKIPAILEEINLIKIDMDDIVREVLSSINSSNESIEATWISRADDKLISISELLALFNGREFDEILDMLDGNTNVDALALVDAIEYISNLNSRSINFLELDRIELDTLSKLAKVSFGPYTNIIRDFLNLTYDISIQRPVIVIIPRSETGENNTKSVINNSNQYLIVPNPSNGHFRVETNQSKNYPVTIDIYDSVGKLLFSDIRVNNDEISLKNCKSGIYFVQVTHILTKKKEMHKVIIN